MSNSENLEQFIRKNRPDFDHAEPGAQVWSCIEKALDRSARPNGLEQFIHCNRALFDHIPVPDRIWTHIEQALSHTPASPADPLESYIREHRASFDTETPDLRVWAAIEKAVPASSAKIVSMPWRSALLRVAASIALLIAGVSIGIWYARSGDGAASGMAMSDVSSEYAELEQYYQRDITAKQSKLATLASYRDQDLNDDLVQMDNMMAELRQELANVPPGNREQVIRAMIDNYKAKAAILERVLEHLEQQQPATTNSGNHENIKI